MKGRNGSCENRYFNFIALFCSYELGLVQDNLTAKEKNIPKIQSIWEMTFLLAMARYFTCWEVTVQRTAIKVFFLAVAM